MIRLISLMVLCAGAALMLAGPQVALAQADRTIAAAVPPAMLSCDMGADMPKHRSGGAMKMAGCMDCCLAAIPMLAADISLDMIPALSALPEPLHPLHGLFFGIDPPPPRG